MTTTRDTVCIIHPAALDVDSALELATAARAIVAGTATTALVFGGDGDLEPFCSALADGYARVWQVRHEALAYPNPEVLRPLCKRLIPDGAAVVLPHNALGMDLGPGLAIELGAAYVPDCIGIEAVEGDILTAARQEFGGQVNVRVQVDLSGGGVVTIRPGAFAASQDFQNSELQDLTDTALEGGLQTPRRRHVRLIKAEAGDVDISRSEILVSCGRGIESEENIELVKALAEAVGGDVSCSRPIVDARWMDRSRQVGTSGQTVRPRVYLALGISGTFQHMAGIRGNPFIVAINKNPRAPIFQVADVGIEGDLLDYVPELTELARGLR